MGFVVLHMEKAHGSDSGTTAHIERFIIPKNADPYARTPQQSACTYCEFSSACHFENGRGGDRMEYIQATKTDEFWRYIDERNGEEARSDG